MGWSSGSLLFNEVINTIKNNVVDDYKCRKIIYRSLITAFEEIGDCDTLDECRGKDEAFDEAWFELYGEDE